MFSEVVAIGRSRFLTEAYAAEMEVGSPGTELEFAL